MKTYVFAAARDGDVILQSLEAASLNTAEAEALKIAATHHSLQETPADEIESELDGFSVVPIESLRIVSQLDASVVAAASSIEQDSERSLSAVMAKCELDDDSLQLRRVASKAMIAAGYTSKPQRIEGAMTRIYVKSA